ncbi:50S ribosomal protein L2 [candidate division WWE3 bacterium CG_4_9_14_0_2_um_filter_35_11]|uniref:50S ribosomal protein L2 n=1 Tax=candidate division WWE3 bacterium CG_4_9_14_0_2_um_filter_35_11 TaxID=1975077 RepID=A0A2M8EL00_UNCKA|nr:MAG: 50S ribosomal protein L2 [candidate division WWE3 bacterium CG10_big_fil_rev_8_21_14_0_10_35_32]PJC23422.1 MAG: 50S ribosomal protein L2 [candidate division WWE3 bacterium CG_4_9_14_0_2_um_filter_35_11]
MIKKMKPTSPGRRAQSYLKNGNGSTKSTKAVRKNLTSALKGPVARSAGRISIQCRWRGAKSRYRLIDFKRSKYEVEGTVESFEYDPNRSCDIALILYVDGDRRYILAPNGLKIGDNVKSGESVDIVTGNALPLKQIPVGVPVHNLEMYPKAGGKFIRGAGTAAYVTAKEGKYVDIKLPSGEIKKFLGDCYGTIGQIGNEEHKLVSLGKAGRAYHMGKRPKNRGKARSDGHPHGGSYSRRVGRQPVDQWGNLAKGGKTRKRKHTNKFIVKSRRLRK